MDKGQMTNGHISGLWFVLQKKYEDLEEKQKSVGHDPSGDLKEKHVLYINKHGKFAIFIHLHQEYTVYI